MNRGSGPTIAPDHPCNLCGSRDAVVVSERDRRSQPLRSLLCLGCGLVYTDPRPQAAELAAWYREGYRLEYKGHRHPRPMQVYRNTIAAGDRLARMQGRVPPAGRLLDVGSGSGEFLYLARHAGYRTRGLEPDSGYSAWTRDHLGLEVETRPLDAGPPSGAPFDVITIFHVLEHLGNPREAVATLSEWLRPSGYLVVEVPNIESRCTAPHHRFHRAHLFHFNTETLSALGEMSDLRVSDTVLSQDGGTVTIIFTREPPPSRRVLEGNAARVREALDAYTNLRHYLGGTLLRQQVEKLGRNLRGRWVCRGAGEPAEVLERLIRA